MTARTGTDRPPRRAGWSQRVSVGQYRRRRLAAALVALLLVVGLGLTTRVLLYDLGLADVEQVRVTGTATVPTGDVLAAAAVPPGGPLAAVDLSAVAERVARLPAVGSVRVGRSWPHAVAVDVTERVPVAVVGGGGEPALVDRTGVVYRGAPVPGLPELSVPAPATDDPATLAAVAVLAAVPEPVRGQVRSVRVPAEDPGGPDQVTLGLTDDREIRWGAPELGPQKAAVLLPLLAQPGRAYDVTSPDLPSVRP